MATFKDLGVADEFIKALHENNISSPTEIQIQAIPYLLKNDVDFIGQAQTGTGKTAAFGLPVLHKVDPSRPYVQALILSPTRELAQQIARQLFRFTKYSAKIFVEAVYGGEKIGDQIKALMRPTQIVVATPGRLVELLEKNAVDLRKVKIVVLDEADEMLSMGFKEELNKILSWTRGQKSTWLFSATMPPDLQRIIQTFMSPDAKKITVGRTNTVNASIEHQLLVCDENQKPEVLVDFLKSMQEKRGIIFCRTKANAQLVAKQLVAKNIAADAIHGDLMQTERDKVMRAVKNKKIQVLVATDISARGIDIEDIAFVVHYQLPDQMEYYLHRSGRTGRAGKKGLSLILASSRELNRVKQLELDLKISVKRIS